MEDERTVSRTYTELGIAAVVCGVLGLVFLVLTLLPGLFIVHWAALPLGVLAIVFGSFAYWGLERDSLGLAGFGLGMLLIILWFLLYVYASVTGLVGVIA